MRTVVVGIFMLVISIASKTASQNVFMLSSTDPPDIGDPDTFQSELVTTELRDETTIETSQSPFIISPRDLLKQASAPFASSAEENLELCTFDTGQNLTALTGNISWTGRNSATCLWFIYVPASYGIVLQFNSKLGTQEVPFETAEGVHRTSVKVFNGSCAHPGIALRTSNGILPIPVLVWPGNQLCVQAKRSETDDTGKGLDNNSSLGFLQLTYEAHPLQTLPVKKGEFLYDCSPPHVIPEALKCDMVQHCLRYEDEKDCGYQAEGCPDYKWVPYEDYCFKFHTKVSKYRLSSYLARDFCEAESNEWRSYPAQLTKPAYLRFVGEIATLSGFSDVMVGLQKASTSIPALSHFFRFMWQWSDSRSLAVGLPIPVGDDPLKACAVLVTSPYLHFRAVSCVDDKFRDFVCMMRNPKKPQKTFHDPVLPKVKKTPLALSLKRCEDGSLVHPFHYCQSEEPEHRSWSRANLPLFQCSNGVRVHYSLLCDGNSDCGDADHSDETCATAAGDVVNTVRSNVTLVRCKWSSQYIRQSGQCNGVPDCFDQSDEEFCTSCSQESTVMCRNHGCVPPHYVDLIKLCRLPKRFGATDFITPFNADYFSGKYDPKPMLINFDSYGLATVQHLKATHRCPDTHFQCPNEDCVPTYLLGMLRHSCPNNIDFVWSERLCKGHYQCYMYDICLHPDFLCDGIYHCPLKDDERYCDLPCPTNCTCEGHALTCVHIFDVYEVPFARYLDMSGSTEAVDVRFNLDMNWGLEFLVFLNQSFCGLKRRWYGQFKQLRVLDLSFNQFQNLSSLFLRLRSLTHLNLSGNPLLQTVDDRLSRFLVTAQLLSVTHLSLQSTGIVFLQERVLENMTGLVYLDIHDNTMDYDRLALYGLENLRVLKTDDYKLCCYHEAAVETDVPLECQAPVDELSSCARLLRFTFFRVMVWLMAVTSIVGNVSVLVLRLCCSKDAVTCPAHRVLVANLSLSDLLMGLYVLLIAVADLAMSGQYLWKEQHWRRSALCSLAGFLALLSSEVSSLLICLITVDRLLLLRFPLRQRLHLQRRGAMAACGSLWLVGFVIAVVPLLPGHEHWQFYGQTGICLPLPITRRQFPGQAYSFSIFIVLNLVLFLLIGAGQVLIYRSIQSTPLSGSSERRQQDMTVARRLFLIVLTDFCCWVPVCVMGLMAAVGDTPIPDDVNVWVAVCVLPINSAINPFLYTLHMLLERWRHGREKVRVQHTVETLHLEALAWRPDRLREFLQDFVDDRLIKKEWLLRWLDETSKKT